jgi:hypothetical protein
MSGSVTISSKGRSGAVEVDSRAALEMLAQAFMQRFSGILFEVGAGQVDVFSLSPTGIFNLPPSTTGSSYWLI